MEDLEKPLIDFGLTSSETKVYLSLVELGYASVSELSRHSGINRSTVYVILESLKNKGLVKISDDSKVRKFIASPPDTLLEKAATAAHEQLRIKSSLETILPQLRALYKGTLNKPTVKIYEGKEGLWQIYTNVFNSGAKSLWIFEDLTNILKIFPDFTEYDAIQRLKTGMDIYSISPARIEIADICLRGVSVNTDETLFIPKERFKFPVDIAIYDDKVAFTSPKDLFGIVIQHKEIAASLKSAFDLAFAEAKRLNDELGIKTKKPSYNFRTPKDKTRLPAMLKLLKESFDNTEKFLKKHGS